MRVFFVVTHLLGSGHLSRTLVLARAHLKAGHCVTLVSGGMPVPHLSHDGIGLVQLPPLRSDGVNFTRLLDENADIASEGLMQRRRDVLLSAFEEAAPDVVVTELYPFGRRSLTAEFMALLEKAKMRPTPPCICCSIRDILAPPSKPSKVMRVREIIAEYYDAILVHSDPDITPLDASWPVTDDLLPKLNYSGFVAHPPAPPHPTALGEGRILVSAGGGAVGDALYSAALGAAKLDGRLHWHILVGGADAHAKSAALSEGGPANATVEPARPDFRQMLNHAKASVSMCGYNTALDILQAGTPAVFVPFDAGGEVEQSLRAKALAKMAGIRVLNSVALKPEALLNTVQTVVQDPERAPQTQGLDGAADTVSLLETLVRASGRAG